MRDEAPLRSEFPILERTTYLNTCSLGAFGRSAERRVAEFHGEWSRAGASAWYETWWSRLEETRRTFASLVGATAGEIALLPSVSAALSVVASCLDHAKRPEVVTSRMDFPTIPYQWLVKKGTKARFVGDRAAVSVPAAAYEEAIGPRTAAVATCHVLYTTGAIQPVAAICKAARRAGALSIIDSYHGVGQLPVDVRELGCDVLLSGGLKWLLGGPGCVLMYVRKALIPTLEPTVTGWFANEAMFGFDPERFAFRDTAARFELGTPALPSVFATLGGMECVAKLGPRAIRARQEFLLRDLDERLQDVGFTTHAPADRGERAGILAVPVADAEEVVRRLAAQDIIVDHREGRVRISPYFYNTVGDNEKVVDALRGAARPPR